MSWGIIPPANIYVCQHICSTIIYHSQGFQPLRGYTLSVIENPDIWKFNFAELLMLHTGWICENDFHVFPWKFYVTFYHIETYNKSMIYSVTKKTTLYFDYQQYIVNNFLEPCGGLTVISELKCLNLDY